MFIVTYHAVEGTLSPVCCPPDLLDAHLTGLAAAGFTFVSLDDCAQWVRGDRPLPARAVAITFDDAYRSVVTNALPILQRHHAPATMYVIGERIGGDNQWPGQWSSIGRMPLCDRGDLARWVAAGMAVGSHSWSHPRLPSLDAGQLAAEVTGSAARLEDAVQAPVQHFAFPYGDRGAREVAAARERYRTAVNATSRVLHSGDDLHDLHRLDCHDLGLALRLGCFPVMGPYLALRRGARQIRRLADRVRGDL